MAVPTDPWLIALTALAAWIYWLACVIADHMRHPGPEARHLAAGPGTRPGAEEIRVPLRPHPDAFMAAHSSTDEP